MFFVKMRMLGKKTILSRPASSTKQYLKMTLDFGNILMQPYCKLHISIWKRSYSMSVSFAFGFFIGQNKTVISKIWELSYNKIVTRSLSFKTEIMISSKRAWLNSTTQIFRHSTSSTIYHTWSGRYIRHTQGYVLKAGLPCSLRHLPSCL